MRRTPLSSLLNTLLIALVAFVSGGALVLVTQTPTAPPIREERDASSIRVARLYYDAVNSLLDTGSPEELDAHIGSEFASYARAGGGQATGAELVEQLQEIRSTHPRLRVTVEQLSTSADLVFASIRLVDASGGQFVGFTVDSPEAGSFEEVLRIQQGRIVERWGADWFPMRMLDVLRQTIQLPDEATVTPELRRWRFGPNGFGDSSGASWRFVLVESGPIAWSLPNGGSAPQMLAPSDGRWTAIPLDGQLETGELMVVPAGTLAHFTNADRPQAQLLVLELTRSGSIAAAGRSEGVTRALLARGLLLRPSAATLTIALGQFRLPAGGSWSHAGLVSGGEMTFVVDGELSSTTDRGLCWTVDRQSAVVPSHAPVIPSGEAVTIEGDSLISYAADASMPVSGWIITFAVDSTPV